MVDFVQELRKSADDENRRMATLTLSLAVGAIAFVAHEITSWTVGYGALFAAFAVTAWSLSFVSGIKYADHIFMQISWNAENVETPSDQAVRNFRKHQGRGLLFFRLQRWLLFVGAVLYFVGAGLQMFEKTVSAPTAGDVTAAASH